MAYTVQAIVIPKTARPRAIEQELACVDLLVKDLCLVPLPYNRLESLGIPFLPLTDDGDSTIGQRLEELCLTLSKGVKVAYVEAEFFGGAGTQANVLYENGIQISDPVIGDDAINQALRWLGVQRDQDNDEFLVAGFGMHRNTEDWLENK